MDFRKNPVGLEGGFGQLSDEAYQYLRQSDAAFGTPIERLLKMNPQAYQLYKDNDIDLEIEILEITVCAQHLNGGVAVDANWESTVGGLYGEIRAMLDGFWTDIAAITQKELPRLHKCHDTLCSQAAVLSAMLFAAEKYGSRGGALVEGAKEPGDAVADTVVITRNYQSGMPLGIPGASQSPATPAGSAKLREFPCAALRSAGGSSQRGIDTGTNHEGRCPLAGDGRLGGADGVEKQARPVFKSATITADDQFIGCPVCRTVTALHLLDDEAVFQFMP